MKNRSVIPLATQKTLVTKSSTLEEKHFSPLFNKDFCETLILNFKKHSKKSQIKLDHDIHETILTPILIYMRDLRVTKQHKIFYETREARSLVGLFLLIEGTKKNIEKNYSKTLAKEYCAELSIACTEILENTKAHIKTNFGALADKHNEKIVLQQHKITLAKKRKHRDFFCCVLCLCWCPVEYTITCFNCFWMTGEGGIECGGTVENGNLHFFSPCSSIKSTILDYKEQNKVMDLLIPQTQHML